MKNWLIILVVALIEAGAFAAESSILYPRQIQPKLTLRQRCQLAGEWKRYGSMRDCIEEKHHEELVALQNEDRQRSEERTAEAPGERRQIRDEARKRFEYQLLRDETERLIDDSR